MLEHVSSIPFFRVPIAIVADRSAGQSLLLLVADRSAGQSLLLLVAIAPPVRFITSIGLRFRSRLLSIKIPLFIPMNLWSKPVRARIYLVLFHGRFHPHTIIAADRRAWIA